MDMKAQQQVKFTIDAKGVTKMEAMGAKGKECLDWTKELQRIMQENDVVSQGKKPEFDMVVNNNGRVNA